MPKIRLSSFLIVSFHLISDVINLNPYFLNKKMHVFQTHARTVELVSFLVVLATTAHVQMDALVIIVKFAMSEFVQINMVY